MLFGNTKCRSLNVGFIPPKEDIVKVSPTGDAEYYSVTPLELETLSPVQTIETDLQTLFDAGIQPQEIPVAGLLNPSNPSTLQEMAEDKLTRFANSVNLPSETVEPVEPVEPSNNSISNE